VRGLPGRGEHGGPGYVQSIAEDRRGNLWVLTSSVTARGAPAVLLESIAPDGPATWFPLNPAEIDPQFVAIGIDNSVWLSGPGVAARLRA